jgi:uncharacterized membrane protein
MTKPLESEPGSLDRFIIFLETDNGQRVGISVFSVVATLVLLAFPGGMLAYVFGIPFMFFIPGFAVVRLFFWKGTSPEARFVLSMGISILVLILLGLLLVLTPIGLDSNTTRASLVVFALAAVAIETFWLNADRSEVKKQVPQSVSKPERVDKVVVAMLATALVVSGISLGLVVTAKYPSRTYFAVTDENGRVITNTSWFVFTNLTLIVHMKNGEDGARNFTLLTAQLASGFYLAHNISRMLNKNEIWNQTISFNLTQAGIERLDFDLYIQKGTGPPYHYGNLHIWMAVNTREP